MKTISARWDWYDLIKKHNLEVIETIDKNGYINYLIHNLIKEIERFLARKKSKNIYQIMVLLKKIEKKTTSNVGYSERSGRQSKYCSYASMIR